MVYVSAAQTFWIDVCRCMVYVYVGQTFVDVLSMYGLCLCCTDVCRHIIYRSSMSLLHRRTAQTYVDVWSVSQLRRRLSMCRLCIVYVSATQTYCTESIYLFLSMCLSLVLPHSHNLARACARFLSRLSHYVRICVRYTCVRYTFLETCLVHIHILLHVCIWLIHLFAVTHSSSICVV